MSALIAHEITLEGVGARHRSFHPDRCLDRRVRDAEEHNFGRRLEAPEHRAPCCNALHATFSYSSGRTANSID